MLFQGIASFARYSNTKIMSRHDDGMEHVDLLGAVVGLSLDDAERPVSDQLLRKLEADVEAARARLKRAKRSRRNWEEAVQFLRLPQIQHMMNFFDPIIAERINRAIQAVA
jgi:hypothetical protein